MENPASWTVVQHTITEVLAQHRKDQDEKVCGASLQTMIYEALKSKGLLNEAAIQRYKS